ERAVGFARFPRFMQPGMNVLHEGVEMNAPLGLGPGAREEGVHEHGLAASDLAPQVDTLRHFRMSVLQKPGEEAILVEPIVFERPRQALKPIDDERLRRITPQNAVLKPLLIIRPNAHPPRLWRGPTDEASLPSGVRRGYRV